MLTPYQLQQLTNQSECYIHTHPRVDNFTFPHGGFSDTTDQTAAAFTPTAMKLNTTDVSDSVVVRSLTQLVAPREGVYNVQFSAQFANTDASAYEASVWFRVNGTDVTNSATQLTVPGKHAGADGHAVAAWNIFLKFAKADYVEIIWCAQSTAVFIEAAPARTTPSVRPAVPSVIATMNFVSDR
jgi:hypothetical protein